VHCLNAATLEQVEVELFDDDDREASDAKVRGLSQES
jgi:hypothetical protein